MQSRRLPGVETLSRASWQQEALLLALALACLPTGMWAPAQVQAPA